MAAFRIGIPIVEQFDLMDVANPYEVFCWLKPFWRDAGAGGGDSYIDATRKDADLLNFIRDHAEDAKWVASVCTGVFVLAEAGLLNGARATTHWMFLDELGKRYPAIQVVNGYPRFVRDGKLMTGGGISSGIDEALYLAGEIAGEQIGRDIELAIQYKPQPPYGVGDPRSRRLQNLEGSHHRPVVRGPRPRK
jgi:transcriptional regulator GlxA family with amidase domain